METLIVAGLMGCVSLLYATAGQAGGTAFLAVMAFAGFPAAEMRPTALLLNIIAAGYATWRLHQSAAIDRRMLVPLIAPSLVTAFVGGTVVLAGRTYFILTGVLLIAAAALMALRRVADAAEARPVHPFPLVTAGAGAGFISGLTGVGGGVFLTPVLIVSGWTSPRRAAALSPPFILCNSTVGLVGALLAGQTLAPGTLLYSLGALTGAIAGTAIGLQWFTERTTRFALAIILLFAGLDLAMR
jgi:uncharacterized protein